MKLTLTTDQGTVLNIWENVDDWDMRQHTAKTELGYEIHDEMFRGRSIANQEGEIVANWLYAGRSRD